MNALLAASVLLVACAGPAPQGERVERRLGVMGTGFEIEVTAASRREALRASEAAVRAVEAVEARLSTWTESSELAALNRAAVGQPHSLSPELAADLASVRHWWQATEGAFDAGVGRLVAVWDLRGSGRVPTDEERRDALTGASLAHLGLEHATAVRRHAGLRIEEGGFGKGRALDEAAAVLRAAGVRAARLDLGGQLHFLGDGARWIEVADPRDRAKTVLRLRGGAGSIATSGNSERGHRVAGTPVGHLLDPRTGLPAADFGSVTVLHAEATAADCLATALFVLGPDAALAWAEKDPATEVLVLEPQPDGDGLRARASAGLRGRVEVLHPRLALESADAASSASVSPPHRHELDS